MLTRSRNSGDPGTESPIGLSINESGTERLNRRFSGDTPQEDLERGQANLYFIPVSVAFTLRSLRNDSIRLPIKGGDAWSPSKLFLFGFDDASGRPKSIVPLVHLPQWDLGQLGTDGGEGREQETLPLVRPLQILDTGPIGGTLGDG